MRILFEAQLDTKKVEEQVKAFEQKIANKTLRIKLDNSGVDSLIDKINRSTITPKVDHKPLDELNRHLDKKLSHYKSLQRYFDRNPLKITYIVETKRRGGDPAMSSQSPNKPSGGGGSSQQSIFTKNDLEVINNLKNSNEKAINRSTKILQNVLKQIENNTKKGFLGNIFQGIALEIGQGITRSQQKRVMESDRGKKVIDQFDQTLLDVGNILAKRLGGYTSKSTLNPLIDMFEDIGSLSRDVLKINSYVKNTRRNLMKAFVMNEYDPFAKDEKANEGKPDLFQEALKSEALKIQKKFRTQINNFFYETLKAITTPLAVNTEFQVMSAAKAVSKEGLGKRGADRIMKKYEDEIKDKDIITLTVGGFQKERGGASNELAEMLRPMFDKNVGFVPLPNVYTDRKATKTTSSMNEMFEDMFGKDVLGKEGLSMVMNIEKLFGTAIKGMNPDAVRMAALALQIEKENPGKQIQLTGFSGGGYIVEQAMSILETLGKTNMKGVGIGSPLLGLTNFASEEQYTALVGKTDALAFPYADKFTGGLSKSQAEKAEEFGIPSYLVGQGFATPPESVSFLQDFVGVHDVQSYLGSKEALSIMQEKLGGMVSGFGMGKLGEKTTETLRRGVVDDDDLTKFDKFIKELDQATLDLVANNKLVTQLSNLGQLKRKNLIGSNFPSIDPIMKQRQKIIETEPEDLTSKQTEKLFGNVAKLKEAEERLSRISKLVEKIYISSSTKMIPKGVKDKAPFKEAIGQSYQSSDIKMFVDDLSNNISQQLSQLSGKALEVLGVDEGIIAKLDPSSLSSIASYLSKRQTDDPNIMRGIEMYERPDEDPTTPGKYEFYNPKEGEKRVWSMGEYIEKGLAPLIKDLSKQEKALFDDYLDSLRKLQKELNKFVKDKTKVNEETIEKVKKTTLVPISEMIDFDELIKIQEEVKKSGGRKKTGRRDRKRDKSSTTSVAVEVVKEESKKASPLINEKVKEVTKQVAENMLQTAKTVIISSMSSGIGASGKIFGAIKAVEDVTLDLLPYGKLSKGVLKNTILPAATFGAATHFIPGGGMLAEGMTNIASSGLNMLGGGAIEGLTSAATGALGNLPMIGGQLGNIAASGIQATGSALTSGVAEIGTALIGGKMIQNAISKAGQAAASNILPPAIQQDIKALPSAVEDFSKDMEEYVKRAVEIGKKFTGAAKQLKKLKGEQQKVLAESIYKSSSLAIAETKKALELMPKDKRMASPIASRLGQLGKVKKASQRVLEAQNVDVSKLTIDVEAVELRIDDSATAAMVKDVQELGKEYVSGVIEGLNRNSKKLADSAKKVMKKMHEASKDELDIRSPSGEGEVVGKEYIRGVEEGAKARADVLYSEVREVLDGIKDAAAKTEIGMKDFLGQDSAVKDNILSGYEETVSNIGRSVLIADQTIEQSARVLGSVITDQSGVVNKAFIRMRADFGEFMKEFKEQSPLIAGLIDNIGKGSAKLVASIGLLFATFAFSDDIVQLTRESFELGLQIENLERKLSFTTAGDGARRLEEIRELSKDLGVNFLAAAEGFAMFSASSMGTDLQEQADQLFESFTKGFAAFGLNAEAQEGSFLAISQMMSKGIVSAEELRQQLGERLPGALNIAARSMGMTAQEFNNLLNTGSIMSNDLLPNLARQLELETELGLFKTIQSTQAELNRFQSNLDSLRATIGKGLLSGAKLGLPIINDGLNILNENLSLLSSIVLVTVVGGITVVVKSLIALNAQTGIFNGLIGITKGTLKALAPEIFVVNTGLSTMGKTMAITGNIFTKVLIPMGATVATLAVLIKQVEGMIGVFNAYKTAAYDSARASETYANSLAKIKAPNEDLENSVRSTTQEMLRGNTDSNNLFSNLFNGEAWSAEFKEAWDILTFTTMKEFREFITTSENIERTLNDTMNMIMSAQRGTRDINLGGGVTVRDDYSLETLNALEKKLSDLRSQSTAVSIQLEIAKGAGDMDLVKQLAGTRKDLQDEINRIIKETLPSQPVLEKQLQNLKALESSLKKEVAENRAKGNEDFANSLADQLKQVQAEQEKVNDLIEQGQEAQKDSNKLYAKQVKMAEMLRKELANINFAGETQSLESQINLTIAKIQGQLSKSDLEVRTKEVKTLELRTRFTEAQKAFDKYEDEFLSRINNLAPEIKTTISSELGVDDIEKALKDKTLSPEAIAELFGTANEGLAEKLGNPSEVKAILELAQQYLNTWKDVKSTQLDYVQSVDEENSARRERTNELRDFARQLQDYQFSYEDYFRNQGRQVSDFRREFERLGVEIARENRDLLESYQDLSKKLTKSVATAENRVETLAREIDTLDIFGDVRDKLSGSSEGLFGGLSTTLESVFNAFDGLNRDRLTIEEQRLANEEEILSLSREIRSLGERREDLERNRLDRAIDLSRRLEDFVREQQRSWLSMTRQVEDMEIKAREMGVTFESIGATITNISNLFNQVYQKINQNMAGMQTQPMMGGGSTNPYDPLLDLISSAEGTFTSFNRGNAGDSAGETLETLFGKALGEISLGEIVAKQVMGQVFAVGAYQFIPDTLKAAIQRTGMGPETKFTPDVQKELAINLLYNRKAIKQFLETGKGLENAVQDLAREWASIGLAFPEAGRSRGQSRYAGTGNNAAHITPEQAAQMLTAVRSNLTGTNKQQMVAGGGQLVGYTGDTGFSTGPHLDIRARDRQGNRINPERFIDMFTAGGKSLREYTMTSGYGARESFRKGPHQGVDFGTPVGLPLHFKGQGQVVKRKTPGQSQGGGYVVDIRLDTGELVQLLHLEKRSMGLGVPQQRMQAPAPMATPAFSTGNAGNAATAISDSFGTIVRDIEKANYNFLKTEEGIREFFKVKNSGDMEDLEAYMKKQKITLEGVKNRTQELEIEKHIQKIRATRQQQEQIIKRDIENTKKKLTDIATRYKDMETSIKTMEAEAKGFLHISENHNLVMEETAKKYDDQIKQIDELGKSIEKMLDLKPGENLDEEFSRILDRVDEYNLGQEFKTEVEKLISEVQKGATKIDDLGNKITSLRERAVKAKEIGLETKEDELKIEALTKKASALTDAYGGLTETLKIMGHSGLAANLEISKGIAETDASLSQTRLNIQRSIAMLERELGTEKEVELLTNLELKLDAIEEFQKEELTKKVNLELQLADLQQVDDIFGFIGQKKREFKKDGMFDGDYELGLAKAAQITSEYLQQLEKVRIAKIAAQNEGDMGIVEMLEEAQQSLHILREMEIENIPNEINTVLEGIQGPIRGFFSGMITEFIMGQKSMGELFSSLLTNVADFFAQLATQMVTNQVMQWIGGMLGNVGLPLFGGGGMIAPRAPGISPSTSTPNFFTAAMGGEIPNFAGGGFIYKLDKAMKKEGMDAVPIVASVGEQILSKRNQDAQFYRAMQKSGQWNYMKKSWVRNKAIPTFNQGGMVGGGGRSQMSQSPINNTNNRNNSYNTVINIQAKDVNSFHNSRSVIAQEERARRKKESRFT